MSASSFARAALRSVSCGEVVVRACREAGFEPRIAFESDEYQVLQGYVSAGLGFTLLPDLAVPTLHPDLVVRPTEPKAPGESSLRCMSGFRSRKGQR